MKEELISFSTAKLAKEKGFDIPCYAKYSSCGSYMDNLLKDVVRAIGNSTHQKLYKCNDGGVLAPTQALLQKWLREEHNIFIYCIPKKFIKGNERRIIRWGNNIMIRENKYSSTYEKALEEGLKEALKLIK
jgi:hypothetical protein